MGRSCARVTRQKDDERRQRGDREAAESLMRECINMRENEAKAQQREAGRRKSTAKKQNDSEKNIKRTMCQTELKEKSNRDDSVTTAKKNF